LYNLATQKSKQLQKKINSEKGLSINLSRVQSRLHYYQYYSDNPIKNNIEDDVFPKLCNSSLQYQLELQKLLEVELYNRQKIYGTDYSRLINFNVDSTLIHSLDLLQKSVTVEHLSDTHIIITYYIQNLISRFYNITNEVLPKDIHEMYSYAIESGVLLDNGTLSVVRFDNLVNSIAQMSTVDETSEFINQWIDVIDVKNREALLDLSEAKNQYFHNNYAQISNTILYHNYTNHFHKLLATGLILISLYEDKKVDYDIAVNYCNNMKRFLQRSKSKFRPGYIKSVKNFIKILELLNKTRKDYLEVDINDYHPIYFKNWVISKIKK